ncbi:ATP-binding cassette domain-containing protein [Clostridium sp. MCC353]|uniref:energy-coupling factor ABC transporter ATP-binding protein n=1 Tax=Clostridium sp. MCC353 TaxID=2592646 RepID=UPI001C00E763|nr:ABC transporter ATP-binding protein [Clostridium sp. MCC353]MBT9776350.1 ATP-binding cassette domain-containing protein [Clostridium sp. MCC353]
MIQIKGLHFTYELGTKKVLDGIDLEVPKGGFLGIIGPSGAGKTTLLHAVNGIIPHHFKGDYYGSVLVDGKDTFDTSLTGISGSVGTVFQDIDSQMVASVVEDEILYGLENFGVPKEEIEGRIADSLEMVGITSLRNRDINSLSGGQKQKVAIAAIIALRPDILLLDEPTGELDPGSSRQIFALLKKLNETYGMTIVVVEQKIMLLCEFVKELGVLSEGKMIYHGPVRKVLEHSRELERIGVQCPRVVSLSNAMKEAGYGDGRVCLDLKEAEEMMRRAM